MEREFDFAGELAAALVDRDGAWRFVRGFAREWVAPLAGGDGCGERELSEAEARLGVTLPAALREAYLLLGRRGDLTGNHDHLLSPAGLYVDDRREALVFREENQGAASWGVRLGDLERSDPPVVVRMDLADKGAERWEPWLDRLSVAFVETVLSESLHEPYGLGDFLDALGGDGEDVADALAPYCARLPFPAYPRGGPGPGARWYLGPDVLVRVDDEVSLLARGRTEAGLDGLRGRVAGDWLNG